MDLCLLSLFLFVCILNPYCIESWNLSKKEDLELERQLKLLNKPAIKTINSIYGDIFDCVDFYKQPAFDHPRLKNYTIEKSTLLRYQKRGKASPKSTQGEECPLGTVPIKRITKEDLIRERLATKARSLAANEDPGLRFALVRTKGSSRRYASISGTLTVFNPGCSGLQYSAARIKMSNGLDSIEVGWRVDPSIYNDNKTRFYILTNAGSIYCFDLRCPGFVVTNNDNAIGKVAPKISRIGRPIYGISFTIERGKNDEWNLFQQNRLIGHWPASIFTPRGGLRELASSLEWGGEVYAQPGDPKPPMGAGVVPEDRLDTNLCAIIAEILEGDEHGSSFSQITDVEPFTDSRGVYAVRYVGKTDTAGYLMFYGGPGGKVD